MSATAALFGAAGCDHRSIGFLHLLRWATRIDYRSMVISLRPGMQMERDELCQKLVDICNMSATT